MHPRKSTVSIKKTDIKDSSATRIVAGNKIAGAGPKAALYVSSELKTGVDNVATSTADLEAKVSTFNGAKVAYAKASTALALSITAWDGCFDVLVAVGEKLFVSADDAASCALELNDKARNPLAPPVAVELKQDLKKNLVRIHVERAPGMRAVSTQISTDPTNLALWTDLDGHGANHVITNPAPGNLWVRAASLTARARSEYTAPVLLVVK
jgi:hypothetical protein